MNPTSIILRCFAIFLFTIPNMSFAIENAPVWECIYDGNVHIECIQTIEHATADRVEMENYPEQAKSIRENPASFINKKVRIPLFTPPFDMDFAKQLAKASVCGSSKICSIIFKSK